MDLLALEEPIIVAGLYAVSILHLTELDRLALSLPMVAKLGVHCKLSFSCCLLRPCLNLH